MVKIYENGHWEVSSNVSILSERKSEGDMDAD